MWIKTKSSAFLEPNRLHFTEWIKEYVLQFLSAAEELATYIVVTKHTNEKQINFIECVNYRQAKDRVLFKGFKVVDIDNGIRYSKSISDESGILHLFWLDNITQTWTSSSGLTDIESLSKLGALELTETALKEIGLPKIENND